MMDLLTPTNHAGAYEWASVYLAHFAIGLFLTAIVAALLDAIDGLSLRVGDTDAWLPFRQSFFMPQWGPQ